MRVGVVGVGLAGTSHLFDLASSDRFTIAAVCATRRDRALAAADTFGVVGVYSDPMAMIASGELEAVVIATPPQVSPRVAAISLAAGLPTLIDKPAAPTAAALDEVRRQAGPAEALAAVGYNRRYQLHVRRARRLIMTNKIGRLIGVECRWAGPYTHRYTSGETYRIRAGWGDGVVLDTACHILDTLAFLGITPVTIRQASLKRCPSGTDVAARVELHAPLLNLPVSVQIHDRHGDETWRITLRGTRGRLCLNRTALTGTTDTGPIAETSRDVRRPVDDLIDLAAGRPTCGASLAEGTAVLAIIDQIREQSVRQRSWSRPRAKALGRLNGAC